MFIDILLKFISLVNIFSGKISKQNTLPIGRQNYVIKMEK